jgi:hypothetical protein
MGYRHIVIAGLIVTLLFGCATRQMLIKPAQTEGIKPVGLFVCSSTQLVDDKDVAHRNFVIDLANETLSQLLLKYDVKLLNSKVPYDKAFRKPFGGFYINEKLIADIAKTEDCNSVLIVYYAVSSLNFIPLPGMMVMYDDKSLRDNDNMRLHSRCSLYGWLVSAHTAKIITKSHSVLNPFEVQVDDKSDRQKLGKDYRQYLKTITQDMFSKLAE